MQISFFDSVCVGDKIYVVCFNRARFPGRLFQGMGLQGTQSQIPFDSCRAAYHESSLTRQEYKAADM